MSAGPLRIAYVGVKGPYPRNQLIAAGLARRGFLVQPVRTTIQRGWPARLAVTLCQLARLAHRADITLVAEFSNDLAPATALWSRWTGALHVVDLFTGQYETKVLDRKLVRATSVRGRLAHLQDRLAAATADVVLTDTTSRAQVFRAAFPSTATWVTVPVGVPGWASPSPLPDGPRAEPPLKILYYGGYIPLHGVPTLVAALQLLGQHTELHVTLVGTGQERSAVEAAVRQLPASVLVTFLDRVEGQELVRLIEGHDVVVGAFGESAKAGSVVPNKVWEALSLGAAVVTRHSSGYDDLPAAAGELLHLVPPQHPAATAIALAAAGRQPRDALRAARVRAALQAHVEDALDDLDVALRQALAHRPRGLRKRRPHPLALHAAHPDSRP